PSTLRRFVLWARGLPTTRSKGGQRWLRLDSQPSSLSGKGSEPNGSSQRGRLARLLPGDKRAQGCAGITVTVGSHDRLPRSLDARTPPALGLARRRWHRGAAIGFAERAQPAAVRSSSGVSQNRVAITMTSARTPVNARAARAALPVVRRRSCWPRLSRWTPWRARSSTLCWSCVTLPERSGGVWFWNVTLPVAVTA